MNELELKLQELNSIVEASKLTKPLSEIENILVKSSLELTDQKFTTVLTKTVLEPINDRINKIEKSLEGKSGRIASKKRTVAKKLSFFVQSIYSKFPHYLTSYSEYNAYKEEREKKALTSRDFLFNLEGNTLGSALYPLELDIKELMESSSEIKNFIGMSLKNPQQFEFGKYHLNNYYRQILSSIENIDNDLKKNREYAQTLSERDLKTSIFETYHNEETGANVSIKDEIASLIECNDIEHSNLAMHKEIIEDLKDFIKTFYGELLDKKQAYPEATPNNQPIEPNPYPEIFTSDKAYSVFNKFISRITPKSELADCSFIYRIMQQDNLIFQTLRESDYRRWLDKEYEITIDKTKMLSTCSTPHKETIYALLKEQFSL